MALSLQGYAAHRAALGLRGQSHVAVLRAIESGRLTEPAAMKVGGRWQIEPILADAQWADNTDTRNAPHNLQLKPPKQKPAKVATTAPARQEQAEQPEGEDALRGIPKLAVSKAVRAAYDAKLAELAFKKEAGSRVAIEEVKREAANLARSIRDNVLGIPDRIAPQLAATMDVREVHRMLSDELKIALRALADG